MDEIPSWNGSVGQRGTHLKGGDTGPGDIGHGHRGHVDPVGGRDPRGHRARVWLLEIWIMLW